MKASLAVPVSACIGEKAIEKIQFIDVEHISHRLKKHEARGMSPVRSCRWRAAPLGEGCGDDAEGLVHRRLYGGPFVETTKAIM